MLITEWYNSSTVDPQIYVCGWCHKEVNTTKGWSANVIDKTKNMYVTTLIVSICNCGKPTFFNKKESTQIPGVLLGRDIQKLPQSLKLLYNEIQQASSVNAYTLVILGCRKLLMHVAVEKGADKNLKFVEYVKWFETANYAPPNATKWIDKIRNMGNEANHEITLYSKEQAQEILKLCEMLMTFIYEYGDEEEVK